MERLGRRDSDEATRTARPGWFADPRWAGRPRSRKSESAPVTQRSDSESDSYMQSGPSRTIGAAAAARRAEVAVCKGYVPFCVITLSRVN